MSSSRGLGVTPQDMVSSGQHGSSICGAVLFAGSLLHRPARPAPPFDVNRRPPCLHRMRPA